MDKKAESKHAVTFIPMGENDLMMKINLTLETRDGTAVVEINNAVKVTDAAGKSVTFNTGRKLENHLNLLVTAPFISAVHEHMRKSMDATDAEASMQQYQRDLDKEVEAAQLRMKSKGFWQGGKGSLSADTEGPAKPSVGIFSGSVT